MSKKRNQKAKANPERAMHERQKERDNAQQIDNDLEALAEDCERDMYGDDYEALKWSGWLDRD